MVVSAGSERTAKDYRVDRKRFPYVGIELVAAGRGRLTIAGKSHELGPGVFFCYGRATPHAIEADPAWPMVKYFVDVEGRGVARLLRTAYLTPGTVGQTAVPERAIAIFEELIRAGLDDTPHSAAACRSLLEALLWRLADQRRGPADQAGAASTQAFENYLRCRRELERSATSVRTLGELARRCGFTEAYLCRLFARYDSTTPYRRLVQLRVAHAASLLTAGASVAEVAAKLGYANPFHFSRQFRQVYGTPPSSLRQALPGAASH